MQHILPFLHYTKPPKPSHNYFEPPPKSMHPYFLGPQIPDSCQHKRRKIFLLPSYHQLFFPTVLHHSVGYCQNKRHNSQYDGKSRGQMARVNKMIGKTRRYSLYFDRTLFPLSIIASTVNQTRPTFQATVAPGGTLFFQ